MERIGIYGGTFNPPHIGHLRGAAQAIDALGLNKLILIPDRIAPHKQIPSGSPSPEQRLEMICIAAKPYSKMEVSDLELRREGPSYSYITVQQIHEMYPHAKLYLLMGTDMFTSFLTWKNPEEILKYATLAVMSRGEKGEATAIEAQKQVIEAMGYEAAVIENRVTAISSTQLRRLLAFRCAGEFLPEGVLEYIRENRLYDTRAAWKNLPMEQLEQVVISLLNPNRVAHVLGCRDTAVELAKRWGADVTDAARAGILHDITKAIDGPLQLTLCAAYGKILNDFSRKYPKTLHALTGSLVAERIFGENEEVVSAIAWHTTGKADMKLLQKIIYVADYMEPCRNFPGVERLRELAYSDIDAALKLGLEMTLEHLNRQGAEVSPESRDAIAWLNR
ncbi:MAG: nicotinate (nicotinamide) nucleotide adenylyltransferase [Oscillospiraceae bacterium]|nr:nicotinate (nicotinamide) nucleotide adenylyltransferase [Oscillospiraceae bacterium]